MIVFFVGTPGSGKSYEAVKKIVDNLKMGRTVCTNIDGMEEAEHQEYLKNYLNMDDFTFHQRFRFLTKDQVLMFWKSEKVLNPQRQYDAENDVFDDVMIETDELICPKGSLVIIDEAHKHFNCHDYRETSNRELADWASTHRHDGYDLVLITQEIGKVEKQVRTLTEWTYHFRKVNFFGGAVQKKYLCYAYSGDDHNGTPLSKNVRTYQPDIFPCYKSYSNADSKEVGFMTHVNILKHPVFYAIPIVFAFCLYMFFAKSSFAKGDLFGVSKVQHKFDNVKTKGMQQTADKPAAIPFNAVSSAITQNPFKPVQPALAGAQAQTGEPFMRYHVDGYLVDNGQTIITIGHIVCRLPSPHVKTFSKSAMIAVAEFDYFGEPAPRSVTAPSFGQVQEVQKISITDKTSGFPTHPFSSLN